MSKLQIKKQKAQRKGHYPYKLDGEWFVTYSVENSWGDLYGPFCSYREAVNTAYHNSLQKNIKLIVELS